MTTLISWIAYDQRRFSAAYVATDSRITWDDAGEMRWDAGRKVFPSRRYPDVFAYAGDVLFPALTLSQIVEAADNGVMFASDTTPWQRHFEIVRALQDSFQRRHKAVDRDFSILHLARFDHEGSPSVHAWSIDYVAESHEWLDRNLDVPSSTGVIARVGSGADAARDFAWRWNQEEPLSRSIFSSFCDAIASGQDALSGGAPQLAGFYPQDSARPFCVQVDRTMFLNGLPLKNPPNPFLLEARDRLFQRIDLTTGTLVTGAQVHAPPR